MRLEVGSAAASIQPHVDPQEQAGSLLLIFSNGCLLLVECEVDGAMSCGGHIG